MINEPLFEQPTTDDTSLAPYAALVGVQAFFGSLPVIAKQALQFMPPIELVGFRVGVTAALLTVIQVIRGRFWLRYKGDYLRLAVLSLFGVTFNQLLFITGLSLTKASNTSLLAVTIPIFTLLVSCIARNDSPTREKVFGIVIAAIGVLILIDPRNASFSSQTTLGDLLIIANSLSYGIYVATSKKVIERNGAMRSIMWVFILASLVCVPMGLISAGANQANTVPATVWALVAYIAIGATASPYVLNAWALARVRPSTVAVFVYLQPLIGFIMAVIFIGEKVDVKFLLAAAMVFAGVYSTKQGKTTTRGTAS